MGEAKRKAEAMTNGRYACCGNCPYFRRGAAMQPMGTCHESPPTVLVIGARAPAIQGQAPVAIVDGFWRPTKDTELCGRHPNFVTMQAVAEIDLSKLEDQETVGNG